MFINGCYANSLHFWEFGWITFYKSTSVYSVVTGLRSSERRTWWMEPDSDNLILSFLTPHEEGVFFSNCKHLNSSHAANKLWPQMFNKLNSGLSLTVTLIVKVIWKWNGLQEFHKRQWADERCLHSILLTLSPLFEVWMHSTHFTACFCMPILPRTCTH